VVPLPNRCAKKRQFAAVFNIKTAVSLSSRNLMAYRSPTLEPDSHEAREELITIVFFCVRQAITADTPQHWDAKIMDTPGTGESR
ncbi:hypothetical protein, partial [Candidatus Amarobacter glycogenicus]|uniref:hypothetical protein n=1 Tax=Candidatus Amarobacter glycogenicus TaxID=3140699 RepID=UPI0031CC47EF